MDGSLNRFAPSGGTIGEKPAKNPIWRLWGLFSNITGLTCRGGLDTGQRTTRNIEEFGLLLWGNHHRDPKPALGLQKVTQNHTWKPTGHRGHPPKASEVPAWLEKYPFFTKIYQKRTSSTPKTPSSMQLLWHCPLATIINIAKNTHHNFQCQKSEKPNLGQTLFGDQNGGVRPRKR